MTLTSPARKIAVYGSRRQEGYILEIWSFIASLREAGVEIAVEKKLAEALAEEGYRLQVHGIKICREFPADADTAVSIGGDGTFLRTARWIEGRAVPVVGLNTGHLGFLAENSISDTGSLVKLLVDGGAPVEERFVLEVSCPALPAHDWHYALNEVALLKGEASSMINVRVDCDGMFLAEYSADGLIVATPTGSTAYNLSVGGPVLAPTLENMILSPIAPHTLTLRPLVLSGDSRLRAVVSGRTSGFRLSIDGNSYPVKFGTEILIRKAPHSVITVRKPGDNFASTLRGKLLWGQGSQTSE